MGGILSTIDNNNQVISIMKEDNMNRNNQSNPAINTSELINLYNKGFIKFIVNQKSIKEQITKIWIESGLDKLEEFEEINNPSQLINDTSQQINDTSQLINDTGQQTSTFTPPNFKDSFTYKTMKQIVDNNTLNISMLLLPLLIGSNTGLYSVLKQPTNSDSIVILIPNIIFSENYNQYFDTFIKTFVKKPSKDTNLLIKLLGSINKKENYNIINSEIKLFNIVNLLLRMSMINQLKNINTRNIIIQENIINIIIDEISNIINIIPSDKCYLDFGLIKSEPDICKSTVSTEPTSTTNYLSNPYVIICCCLICIIFILIIVNLKKKK